VELGGSQELLDTYRKALDAHGMDEKILSPALRFTTSDVAASGANLYPMLLTDGPNGVISLGSPIKLAHDKGATILDFRKNLEQVCARYVDAMKNLTQLMDIEIRNPVNCLKLLMKELGIKQKIRNEVVELFVSQNGEGACTAHDLYYAMNEASFLQPVKECPDAFLFLLNDRLHTCFVVKQIPDSGKWRDPHDCRYITAADSFFAVFQPVFS